MSEAPKQLDSKGLERKPWPISWILIVILAYMAFQTAFFLFVAD